MVNYQQLAAEYAQHRRVHPEVLRNLMQAAGLTSASKVLEVGCGTGNYLGAISTAVGCDCFGVDPAERMLATAKERSPELVMHVGRAESLAFSAESFDLVYSVDVIHHVDDRPAYFQEACRVLRREGLICTVTDSEEIIRRRRPLAAYFPETVEVDLGRYPTTDDLRRWCEQAGFQQLFETEAEFLFLVTDVSAYRNQAFSCLHLIPPDAHRRGVARMERDLAEGPLVGNSRYFLLWGRKRARD